MVDQERDHWLLIGYMGSGKSTFASQMSPEYLVLDLDGRWVEQRNNVLGKYHLIATSDVVEIVNEMARRRPDLKGKIGTVIVDSGTSLLDFEQSIGRIKVSRGLGNANDVHKLKADIMRALRGAILQYHCNSCWIFHLEDGQMSGKAQTRTTISKTELERLKSNLNAVLNISTDSKGRRGVKIEWCRYNDGKAAGQVIWDTDGMWKGVPQRVSTFLREFSPDCGYNGNSYSLEWLQAFLAGKGKTYISMDEMRTALDIQAEPRWFDRSAWGAYVDKATA